MTMGKRSIFVWKDNPCDVERNFILQIQVIVSQIVSTLKLLMTLLKSCKNIDVYCSCKRSPEDSPKKQKCLAVIMISRVWIILKSKIGQILLVDR
ncbi:hypothetical protein M0802_011636 [Mischocyttarus mexicanus]|nr:hypothetical protein M0802_011636 [Mischocyttarus mexicanus]